MALLDYIFTVCAVLLGAVWIGIGQELGKAVWARWLVHKFKKWADHWDEKHAKHIKPKFDALKSVVPPPFEKK